MKEKSEQHDLLSQQRNSLSITRTLLSRIELTINGELNGIGVFGASSSSSEVAIDFTVLIHIIFVQITNKADIDVQQNNLNSVGETHPNILIRETIGGLLNTPLPTGRIVDVGGERIRGAVSSNQLAVIL
jgi:hypothetical protein